MVFVYDVDRCPEKRNVPVDEFPAISDVRMSLDSETSKEYAARSLNTPLASIRSAMVSAGNIPMGIPTLADVTSAIDSAMHAVGSQLHAKRLRYSDADYNYVSRKADVTQNVLTNLKSYINGEITVSEFIEKVAEL
jgi:hypothetical protein